MKTSFSKSNIWQLQYDYFQQAGINAWRGQEVPHYVTSNPFIAKSYAEQLIAFLRDLAAKKIDSNEPVYILELGAGHGRLAYHFLKQVENLLPQHTDAFPRFCYVLSDFAAANIDYWKTHPRLQPFINRGWLDVAIVDATDVQAVSLQISGKVITGKSLAQPLVVIANYFFDTIPQELFFVENGKLFECFVETQEIKKIEDGLQLSYTTGEPMAPPYKEPFLASLLFEYTGILKQSYVLFPDVGLRCIEQLRKFSGEGLLLLTADKGQHRIAEIDHLPPPQPATHGSFSLTVNYHALKTYCQQSGGLALFPSQSDFDLTVGTMLFVKDARQYPETQAAFRRTVDQFGPDDFFSLKKMFNHFEEEMTLRDMMAALRLSGYDARYFSQIAQKLSALCSDVTEKEKWTLFQVVHRVWEMYFPLGEDYDLASALSDILYRLGFYEEAIVYYQLSNTLYGERIHIMYNLALCHFYARKPAEAVRIANAILQKEPAHRETLELLQHLPV